MWRRIRGLLGWAVRTLLQGSLGALLLLLGLAIYYLESRPDLELWHLARLDAEFRAGDPVADLRQYRALEERLFAELDAEVVSRVPVGPRERINRFSRGSLSDPGRWPAAWNRSFEWPAAAPRAGVLLLHGLSDSPYSLRALGRRLHGAGAHVVGLRLPGHGTAPSGLVRVRWQDMAAAVRLVVADLQSRLGPAPLYVVGYSTGAALAVHYALTALEDPSLPRVEALVLISPAIGVSPFAVLAVWQDRLGRWLGLEKLAWESIQPEYDPFKYGSFAVNAGDQVYRLTVEIRGRIDALEETRLAALPPILAFQSVVDATVSTRALLQDLFFRLPSGGHELVLFDVNRRAELAPLLTEDPRETFGPLLADRQLDFTLRVITNADTESRSVEARRRTGGAAATRTPLDLAWPPEIYSLSHVALPFPPDDPLYGALASPADPGIQIGALAPRGERGVLRISGDELLRLRWNPFYPYLEELVLDFTGLGPRTGPGAAPR